MAGDKDLRSSTASTSMASDAAFSAQRSE